MNRKTWYAIVVLLGAATGFAFSLKPWQIFSQQKAQAQKVRLDMQSMEEQQTALTERKNRLESPLGKEEYLREKGYVKKGEVPIQVDP